MRGGTHDKEGSSLRQKRRGELWGLLSSFLWIEGIGVEPESCIPFPSIPDLPSHECVSSFHSHPPLRIPLCSSLRSLWLAHGRSTESCIPSKASCSLPFALTCYLRCHLDRRLTIDDSQTDTWWLAKGDHLRVELKVYLSNWIRYPSPNRSVPAPSHLVPGHTSKERGWGSWIGKGRKAVEIVRIWFPLVRKQNPPLENRMKLGRLDRTSALPFPWKYFFLLLSFLLLLF